MTTPMRTAEEIARHVWDRGTTLEELTALIQEGLTHARRAAIEEAAECCNYNAFPDHDVSAATLLVAQHHIRKLLGGGATS